MTHNGKMTLGIICGAVTGVSLGLLMAPASGSQTRSNIRHTAGTWVNRFGRLFTHNNGQVAEQVKKTRQRKAAALNRVNQLKKGLG